MMGHHPASCHDPDCELAYHEHLRSIAISAHATPNRRADTVAIDRKEAGWHKDHAAYRRLRKDIPDLRIDGAHVLEQVM